jgi:hypothetical protein
MHALTAQLNTAHRESPDSPLSRALARSCAAIIYAHWEGFTKEACQAYVDFVVKRRLKLSHLNDGLLKTSLMGLAKRLMAGDELGIEALLDAVRRPDEARARFPKNTMVDTKSNLRYAVFCEIFAAVGFEIQEFATKANFIDRSLCDVRNTVAHGRELFPDPADIRILHSEVMQMMESVRDTILAAVRDQGYRVSST